MNQTSDNNSNILFNNVSLIWRNNAYDKLEPLTSIVTIIIIPYCNTHHRVQIKIKKDYQYKKILYSVFLKNIFIYTGAHYEILSNYITKLIVKLNTIITALDTKADIANVKEDIQNLEKYDNIYKRYSLINKYIGCCKEDKDTRHSKPTVQNSVTNQ